MGESPLRAPAARRFWWTILVGLARRTTRDDALFVAYEALPAWVRRRRLGRWLARRLMERWHPDLRADPAWRARHAGGAR